ncbi:MAG: biotin--[acetyl-CoA-carboxylase] ligase [Hungatella sp.]|nr:biotin--[acetyl-CoA-carboxylase] ligase [Hungatella sp.]
MKAEIIKLLKERNGYVSGQELCGRFGVSRTAVWKVIRQLEAEGYGIEAVRNRGYRLVEMTDVLSGAEIESCMEGGLIGARVVYYEETDSTNTRAKVLAEEGAPSGTLVVAEKQNAGKGRRGRGWSSPPGSGVWMSVVLRPDIEPSHASMLTLTAALGVSEGIYRVTGIMPQIKWPNDLVLSGKKICGILTEMTTEMDTIQYVVTGMGINVNTPEFPKELKDKASSLYLETGRTWRRGPLIGAMAFALGEYYERFLAAGDLGTLKGEYESRLANLNRQVTVLASGGEYRGTCLGIDRQGELLVEREDGTVSRVLAGEVSVRGIYGYV